MRPPPPFACFMLSGLLLVMAPAVFSPAPAAEADIGDFRFECRTPDGKRLKPKFGDVDGVFYSDLPGQRDACLAAVDRIIATCHENTSFSSNTRNREYAGCLPLFKEQARDCAAFFRNERQKCEAGGSGSAGLRNGGAAPDPWSGEGGTGGDSVWDPPASEAADSGGRARTATWAPPAPAADGGGDADRDVSSYSSALSEVLGDAPRPETAQDDYTGKLAELERRQAEEERRVAELRRQAELEAEREAALRAERQALREMQEEAEREREYRAARERRREGEEAWRRVGESMRQTLQRSQDIMEAQRREAERAARAAERQRREDERRQREAAAWSYDGGDSSDSICRNGFGMVISCNR